ncbi:MAG TPA: phospholipase domain-containing protein, partial [Nocardioides sp.]|nr:phospholipase domain-containing protein [Nocardioides sp.]
NHGSRPAQVAVHSQSTSPTPYLLEPNGRTAVRVPLEPECAYKVAIHGPAGFLRVFADARTATPLEVRVAIVQTSSRPNLEWTISNTGDEPVQVRVTDALAPQTEAFEVPVGTTCGGSPAPLDAANGWYDLAFHVADAPTFERRYVGHLEDGEPSTTRPL